MSEVLVDPEHLDMLCDGVWPEASASLRRRRRANTPGNHAEDDLALATLYRSMPDEVMRVARAELRTEVANVLKMHLDDIPTPKIVEAAGVKNRGTVYVMLRGRDHDTDQPKLGAIRLVLDAMRADLDVLQKVSVLVSKKSKPSPAAVCCSYLAQCSERRQWDSYIEMSTLFQLSLLVDAKQRANMLDLPMPRRVVAEVLPHLRDQGWVTFDGNYVVILKTPPIAEEQEARDG